jgi:hypothetical protein
MWRRLAALPGILLVLLLPVGLFAWHVLVQWDRLNNYHQRELGHAAATLEAVAATARVNVENIGDRKPGEFVADQPYLRLAGKDAGDSELRLGNGGSQFAIDVAKVLREVPFPESFDTLLVVNGSGKVVERITHDEWERDLGWTERSLHPLVDTADDGLRINHLGEALAASQPPVELSKLRGSTASMRVTLGGRLFRLFLQPLKLSNGSAGPPQAQHWMLAGLAPYAELQQRSYSMDTYLVAALVVFVLFAALGFPFLKLWFLDKRERFNVFDAYWLYCSTGALASLFTVLVLAGDSYREFSRQGDARLVEMASRLNRNLSREIGAALAQLDDFEKKYGDELCLKEPGLLDRREPKDCRPLPPPQKLMNIDQIAWIGADGRQIRKTAVSTPSELLDVRKRAYFRAVDEDALFSFAAGRRFFVRPDRSITDGRYYTFLSIPSTASGTPKPEAAVLTLHLSSVHEQPLHPGYGFALVDRRGSVLYHSDSRLLLRENILGEVSQTERLRALLLAGKAGDLSVIYHARPHRFHVTPVHDVTEGGRPLWSLIVFRDLSIGRGAAAHALTLAVLWPIPVLQLLLLGMLMAIYCLSRRKHRRAGTWLWPHEGKAGRYRAIAVALIALAPVAMITGWFFSTIAGIIVVAASAALVSLILYNRVKAGKREPLAAVFSHRMVLLLLVWHLAVIPTSGLFRVIWTYELGKLYLYEEVSLRSRQADFRRWGVEELAGHHQEYSSHAGALLDEQQDYHVWPRTPLPVPMSTGPLLKLHQEISELLPLRHETMIRILHQSSAQDAPYIPAVGWFTLTGGLVATAGLLWWIRFNTNRVFFANVANDGSMEGEPAPPSSASATNDPAADWSERWDTLTVDEKLVLLQAHQESIANPRQHQTVRSLLRGGLIELQPDPYPSPKLAAFLDARGRDQAFLDQYERAEGGSGWEQVRWLVLVVLIAVSIFLSLTQPELPTRITGAVTALATTIAGLQKGRDVLLGWLSRSGSESGQPG